MKSTRKLKTQFFKVCLLVLFLVYKISGKTRFEKASSFTKQGQVLQSWSMRANRRCHNQSAIGCASLNHRPVPGTCHARCLTASPRRLTEANWSVLNWSHSEFMKGCGKAPGFPVIPKSGSNELPNASKWCLSFKWDNFNSLQNPTNQRTPSPAKTFFCQGRSCRNRGKVIWSTYHPKPSQQVGLHLSLRHPSRLKEWSGRSLVMFLKQDLWHQRVSSSLDLLRKDLAAPTKASATTN